MKGPCLRAGPHSQNRYATTHPRQRVNHTSTVIVYERHSAGEPTVAEGLADQEARTLAFIKSRFPESLNVTAYADETSPI